MNPYDYLIVGTGMFGATFAWHATQAGKRCLVVESRDHIGGNCYTELVNGVSIHRYGPHIFHTSDKKIWDFVNKFAKFNSYVHRVKAMNEGVLYSLPFNLSTINTIDRSVTNPSEAEAWLASQRRSFKETNNLEEHCLTMIGDELYERLVVGYTTKQWGRHPRDLPASLIKRLPVRTTYNDNYFNDTYQGIPVGGYTQIFEGLLEGCDVVLGVDYFSERKMLEKISKRTVYTGSVDTFFKHSLGTLEYRTLDFDHVSHDTPDFQGCAQINYPSTDVPYTRITEHQHFEPDNVGLRSSSVVTYEVSREWKMGDVPYYPIPDMKNSQLARAYAELAGKESRTIFGGRLGKYQYMDMHQVIAAAMTTVKIEGF